MKLELLLHEQPRRPPQPGTRRHRILALVRRHPGIRKTRLREELDLAWGTLTRDVQALLVDGAVVQHRTGRDTFLFLPQDAPRRASMALDHADAILSELAHDEASLLQLSRSLQLSQTILQHRLVALEADGLVTSHGHAPRVYRRTDS